MRGHEESGEKNTGEDARRSLVQKRVRSEVRGAVKIALVPAALAVLRGLTAPDQSLEVWLAVGLFVAFYFLSAVVGGSLWGLLRPFRRSPGRAILAGFTAALLPFVVLAASVALLTSLRSAMPWWVFALCAVATAFVIGGALGLSDFLIVRHYQRKYHFEPNWLDSVD